MAPWRLLSALLFFVARLDVGAVPRPENIFQRMVKGDEAFEQGQYGNATVYFQHAERLVDIRMDDVATWLLQNPDQFEILHLDNRGAEPLREKGWKAVERFYKEFEKGISSVINNLHHYDAASRRFADSFIEGARYPVDVYMYLTPPDSKSYNYHHDVMDAWMVQLHGWKKWSICDRFTKTRTYDPAKCQNYTLQNGDVMFVPFRTNHYAWTEGELSSHLTVNVERQHYVWASVISSGLRHRSCPSMPVEAAAARVHMEGASGEGPDARIEEQIVKLFPHMPVLSMAWQTPEVGADWVARSTHNDDHPDPDGLFGRLAAEYLRILAEARALAQRSSKVKFADQRCQSVELFSDPADPVEEMRFVADAMRLQAATVFKTGPVEAFSSLAAKRLHKNVVYARGFARAVISVGSDGSFLMAGSHRTALPSSLVEVAKHAASTVVRRGSFTLQDMMAKTSASQKEVQSLLKKLVRQGVLMLVPVETDRKKTEL